MVLWSLDNSYLYASAILFMSLVTPSGRWGGQGGWEGAAFPKAAPPASSDFGARELSLFPSAPQQHVLLHDMGAAHKKGSG